MRQPCVFWHRAHRMSYSRCPRPAFVSPGITATRPVRVPSQERAANTISCLAYSVSSKRPVPHASRDGVVVSDLLEPLASRPCCRVCMVLSGIGYLIMNSKLKKQLSELRTMQRCIMDYLHTRFVSLILLLNDEANMEPGGRVPDHH